MIYCCTQAAVTCLNQDLGGLYGFKGFLFKDACILCEFLAPLRETDTLIVLMLLVTEADCQLPLLTEY
jgi:hypothetical protein